VDISLTVSEENLRLSTSDHFKDGLIEELDDGFERLGTVESPFTLRIPPGNSPPQKVQEARQLHADRPHDERRQDELRSDPIARDLDLWRNNMNKYDFPGVDTLSITIQQKRAEAAADIAQSLFNLSTIERGVEFEDPSVRGRYWTNPPKIELQTSDTDFAGWRNPCVLAHELGHHVDNQAIFHQRFYSEGEVGNNSLFETQTQLSEAKTLSERIRGEITEQEIPGSKNYRKKKSEKAADAFVAMIIEPDRTRDYAPAIAARLEAVFGKFFRKFERKRRHIDKAWLS
jgi:hypothetical protein